jgi:hypothetical protein
LVLGSILAVIAGAFFVAQGLIANATPRTYGFRDNATGAGWLAVMLCALGGALRVLDYVTIVRPRRLTTDLRPR